MSANSKIEWTDHTFNPWWGCVKVSPGCKHCYAEGIANRFGDNIWGPASTSDRRLFGDDHWSKPLAWNRKAEAAGEPVFVFCASMADVFEDHPQVVDARDRLWELIESTPWLTWQLLTKRPENVAGMVPWDFDTWPPNAWIGTSVEDQQRANERIPTLLRIPAPVRFLSVEPLLGPVDLTDYAGGHCPTHDFPGGFCIQRHHSGVQHIDWVIVGGESGPKARSMKPEWVRSLRDQCEASRTAFFFKQWGAWVDYYQAPEQTGVAIDANHNMAGNPQRVWRVGKKAAGRLLDERTHNARPPAHVPSPTLFSG